MQRRLESGLIILERNTVQDRRIFRPGGHALVQAYRSGVLIGSDESPVVDFPEAPGQIIIEGELEQRQSRVMPSDGYLVILRPARNPNSFRRIEINFLWGNNLQVNMDADSWEFHKRLGIDTEKFLYLGTDIFERDLRAKIVKHHITLPSK